MAALSLAQFGSEATDSLSRLEAAATSDVPRVQAAAAAAVASIKGNSTQQPRLAAPPSPRQVDDSPQRSANDESGVAHVEENRIEENRAALKPGPPVENLLEVPANTTGEQASDGSAANSTKPNRVATNAVVRPLRLQPSQHHHVPGQPSQNPRPAPPVLQLDASESGAGKASSNP